jgi:heat shock protein HtpX
MQQNYRVDFRDQIAKNKRKSFVLMTLIFTVLVLLGYVISLAFEPGYFFIIMILAIIISLTYITAGFYNSDKIAIASVKAKKANKTEHKRFYDLVEGLTIASGLPMPKLYIMDSQQINAFASGRDPHHAVICITKGAFEKLDKKELEGVLAHELSHVGNYDIRYMTVATVLVGMIAIISEIFLRSLWFRGNDNRGKEIFIIIGIVLAILAPIAASLVQLSISRKREFTADASAVKFTRYPPGLTNALKKIKEENKEIKTEQKINKAIAPLFFTNPFRKLGGTHPPIEQRIKILEKM